MATGKRLTQYQRGLVERNVNLARSLAMRVWTRNRAAFDGAELVAVAFEGLIDAAQRFDPTREDINPADLENDKAFAGYARRRIMGTILDWQRSNDHVPKGKRHVYKTLVASGHGQGRSAEQLSEITGLDVDKIRAIAYAVEAPPVSLDSVPTEFEQDSGFLPNYALSPHDVEASTLVSSLQQVLADTIDGLPELQQAVVVMRHYTGKSIDVISMELGVNVTAVRVAYTDAMFTIHHEMKRAAS